MGFLRPHGLAGFIDGASEEVARKLVDGDGIMWPGDEDLSLHVGTIVAKNSGWSDDLNRHVRAGETVGRRWEVWRHTEDGEDVRIGSWKMEDLDRIIMDIAPMRLGSPGHADVLDQVEKANEAVEKANAERFKAEAFQLLEHALKLDHDRFEPRNKFFMNDIKASDAD